MKISGHELNGAPHEDVLPLPHQGKIIPIRARAIQSFDEFNKLCPEPEPPGKLTKDGFIPNPEDEGFKATLTNYHKRRMGWMVINSLQDMEWDTVRVENPATWAAWEKDLQNGGLSQVQCNLIFQHVMAVNSLDESKLREARELFLLGQAQSQSDSSSHQSEPLSTPSGEPASESE